MENPKVGSYAVATIQSRPWLTSTQNNTTTTKTRKARAQPVVVHPIFLDCSQLTDDPLWKSVFENAAYGKFPRGFTYREGVLTYKVRSKTFTFEVPQVAYEALPQCVDFIKRTSKIASKADREQDRAEIEERLQNQVTLDKCSWSDIKKKKVKALLISSFIEEVARNYHMTSKQKEYFKTVLNVGFSLGYLDKDDIVFEHGQVRSITGLIYDNTLRKFVIDPSRTAKLRKTTKPAPEPRPKLSFIDMWYEFVDYLHALQERRKPKPLPSAGITRFRIIDGSIESAQTGSFGVPTTGSTMLGGTTTVPTTE